MRSGLWRHVVRSTWLVALGPLAVIATVAAPTPALASNDCSTTGSTSDIDLSQVRVEFLGGGASHTLLMAQKDGSYQGDIRIRVYCGIDGQPIPGSQIQLSTTVANSFVLIGGSWQATTDPASAIVDIPTGDSVVTVKSSSPGLQGWKSKVGVSNVTVTQAFGVHLNDSDYPTASSQLWAQTPELSSL